VQPEQPPLDLVLGLIRHDCAFPSGPHMNPTARRPQASCTDAWTEVARGL
jgi:hypothetical protein